MPKHCEKVFQGQGALESFFTETLPAASGLALLTFCFLLLVFSL